MSPASSTPGSWWPTESLLAGMLENTTLCFEASNRVKSQDMIEEFHNNNSTTFTINSIPLEINTWNSG